MNDRTRRIKRIVPAFIASALGVLVLSSCEGVVDKVKENETAQLVGLVQDQPCVLTKREGKRMAGAYLRQPVAALGFDPIFLVGKETRKGLPKKLLLDDKKIRRLRPNQDDDGFKGSRKSVASQRKSFGRADALPNVYDLTYRTKKIEYEGPAVVGPSAASIEIPSTGAATFSGRVELSIYTLLLDGSTAKADVSGRFAMTAGYGSHRGTFNISDLKSPSNSELAFTSLSWTKLFLCGTRFVSSGKGVVKVEVPPTDTDLGGRKSPFQTGRDAVPLRSSFEASQFSTGERPGSPQAFGGVFVIESDLGTISGVFLSDAPK